MIELFVESCGDLGGYESDFLYLCSFVSSFEKRLKSPSWTFLGMRNSLESPVHDPILREVLRKCFVIAGRTIIGGIDEADSRLDRSIARLVEEKDFECSILFNNKAVPDLTNGLLSLSAEDRLRIIRLVIVCALSSNTTNLSESGPTSALIGMDNLGNRYYLLKDSNLEVGCWKESSSSGHIELVASTTEALLQLCQTLGCAVSDPGNSKSTCVYCNKRATGNLVICVGCDSGVCHYTCLPASELNGIEWVCSSSCRQSHLCKVLKAFIDEIEPLQKSAMRKRRRLAGELHALSIASGNFDADTSFGRTSRTRAAGVVDYSFRDYDKSISYAIRRSEKKSDYTSSEEETRSRRHVSRPLSRDQRMALRAREPSLEPSMANN